MPNKINQVDQSIKKINYRLRNLTKETIKINTENFLKKVIVIPIETNYLVSNTDGEGEIG